MVHDDLFSYGVPDHEIAETIRSFAPDVLGVSCHYSFSRQSAFNVVALAKRLDTRIATVMGGIVPSIHGRSVLDDCPSLDYALVGESERSLVDLLDFLSSRTPSPCDIDGLLFRDGSDVIENPKRHFIEDLDSIPYPARDLVDIHRYMNTGSRIFGLGNRPALSLLTSRSCPNQCSFCNMWMIHGRKWRMRSVDNVLGEIDEIVNKYRAEHIYIVDDTFTFHPSRTKELLEQVIRRGYKIRWNTPNGISVRGIDDELVQLMKRSGCASVCLAIESGSEYIRNTVIGKRLPEEQIVKVVGLFQKAKIPTGGFLVLGMPGEDEAQFRQTCDLVNRLPLSFIVAQFALPFPGTKLYQDLVRMKVIEDGWQMKMDTLSRPAFATTDFTVEDLVKRKRRLQLSFYLHHIPQMMRELAGGRLYWLNLDSITQFLYSTIRLKS
jgi:magnesium-protoporphyrin IX monomethyl ester (oxidative) cyclase